MDAFWEKLQRKYPMVKSIGFRKLQIMLLSPAEGVFEGFQFQIVPGQDVGADDLPFLGRKCLGDFAEFFFQRSAVFA